MRLSLSPCPPPKALSGLLVCDAFVVSQLGLGAFSVSFQRLHSRRRKVGFFRVA